MTQSCQQRKRLQQGRFSRWKSLAGKAGTARRFLRGPIEFDRPKPFSGIRPSGDGPLKRIVNALTGQRPKPTEADVGDDQEQKGCKPAPAA